MTAVVPLALLSTVSACLPIPERIHETPAIRGELLRDGRPAAGVSVLLADLRAGASCERPTATAVTDSVGRFDIPGRSRWVPYLVLLPAHQSQSFVLCAPTEGAPARAFARPYSYQMGGGVDALTLRCDLARLADSAHVADSTGAALARLDPRRPGAPCRDPS